MMLGLLLAWAGIDVVVLEKHKDFFRDFRGDTIHPSTIDLIDELGLRSAFDRIPQSVIRSLDIVVNGIRATPVDFGMLNQGNDRLVLMPQWDLLTLLARTASELPHFRLIMEAEATGPLRGGDRVTGVVATTPDGPIEVYADLSVAADGRTSALREASGLAVTGYGVPIDVLWFRVPRPASRAPDTLAYVDQRSVVITIPRVDYLQTAMLIRKASFDDVKAAGLDEFRAAITRTVPYLEPVVGAVTDWNDVKLLSVQVNRLERWHQPGFLCIGDAAHAMSPAFGVGINYAIQDAVATANLLAAKLRTRSVTEADLAEVQRRRASPVRRMQKLQLRLHEVIAKPGSGSALPGPRVLRFLLRFVLPLFRRTIARVIGRGFRPETIRPELLHR
jgi:2-polyprenyl-6-methoxyphenol hydroxylase-like FAD-dependent oxidoreductase